MILKSMFSRAWILTTLLVVAGSAVCIRLGIWQLDRLEQRRVFNTQVETMHDAAPLDLNTGVPENISTMEWRAVTVSGEYDFENQVALRNQYDHDLLGYHLITPLHFNGTTVLVDRGWIPADGNSVPADWRKYDEDGTVTLTGQIRLGHDKPAFGGVPDPAFSSEQPRLDLWSNLNVARIAEQIPYPILTVYVQPNADEADVTPPIPFQPSLDLSEGSHFGYALQWFSFASILFFGYPFFLRKQVQ